MVGKKWGGGGKEVWEIGTISLQLLLQQILLLLRKSGGGGRGGGGKQSSVVVIGGERYIERESVGYISTPPSSYPVSERGRDR